MGIIRHYRSNDPPQDAMDYLVRADADAAEAYIIDGINTTPHDIAGHYYMDHLRIFGRTTRDTCTYHHYVISFHPGDRDRGLTPELAHTYGMAFARKYFCGCRVVVCTHNNAHIHVHIIVLALRYMDALPDPDYMRTDNTGNVYKYEYRAGHLIHHSSRLWHSMMDHLRTYCHTHGYSVAPTSAATRISSGEYYVNQKGQHLLQEDNALRTVYGIAPAKTEYLTQKEELRRAIRNAAANAADWRGFSDLLQHRYTRSVEIGPRVGLIPLPVHQRMQQQMTDIDKDYQAAHAKLLEAAKNEYKQLQRELSQCYAELKCARDHQIFWREVPNRQVRECMENVEHCKARLKDAQQRAHTLSLAAKVYSTYAKAASIALSHHMGLDAAEALEEMERWRQYQSGCWTEAWHLSDSSSYFFRDGKLLRRISWLQTTESHLKDAERTLRRIQNDSLSIEMDYIGTKTEEQPFPVLVKIEGERIFFKHPDVNPWISGYSLGDDYTLESLREQIEKAPVGKPLSLAEPNR